MKNLKKVLSIFSLLALVFVSLQACNNQTTQKVEAPVADTKVEETKAEKAFVPNDKDIVVLFTNDVHCGVDDNLGYASLAEYKNRMLADGNYVALVDAGDFSQGAPIGTLSKGKWLIDIMKEVGYDFCVPGNHEFDYGMDSFLSNAYDLTGMIYSCNFIDLRTNKPVLPKSKIMTFGNKKVAFVGVTTPESFTKSTPAYFQDENGNYIYTLSEDNTGKALYEAVQKAVDEARNADGADYVVLVGHLGIDGTTDRWKSTEVIKNTTGINAVIDGHSHEVYDEYVTNKTGENVKLAQTGTKLKNIGKLTIGKNGSFDVEMVDSVPPTDGSPAEIEDEKGKKIKINIKDDRVDTFVKGIQDQYKSLTEEVIIKNNQSDLVINNPANPDERIVRKLETAIGDLSADAYKVVMGADIGLMNGGGIRKSLPAGKDITYADCLTVMPYNNMSMLIKCKGQVIKDALELGASKLPEENGGFLQVSEGFEYTVDTTKESKVVLDDKGNFVKVDGEYRVTDIKLNGEELDMDKEYTVASHDYMLRNGGDGFVMFRGTEIVKDRTLPDIDVFVDYLKAEGTENYSNPLGAGRITIK